MNEFESSTRASITQAVKDLFSNKDRYHVVDLESLSRIILDFALAGEDLSTVTEMNRFEFHYRLLGKAVAVAQGWKINCVEEVKMPSQTAQSITQYINNTYGLKL
ncbi:MAG: hypothetical protein AB7S78_09475 [Candidatus Omnitrophota bacterium]